MEMDLKTAIIGLILILMCTVPVVMIHIGKKNKERKLWQSLNKIAQQYKCKINQYEFYGDYIIGIDENTNYVFFFKQIKDESISQFVDLSEIQTCQVVKKSRSVNYNKDTLFDVERIDLIFTPSDKNKAEIKFELYNQEVNVQLSGELQFADRWIKQIKDCLKNKK